MKALLLLAMLQFTPVPVDTTRFEDLKEDVDGNTDLLRDVRDIAIRTETKVEVLMWALGLGGPAGGAGLYVWKRRQAGAAAEDGDQ